jgi:copper chaperone CopZ
MKIIVRTLGIMALAIMFTNQGFAQEKKKKNYKEVEIQTSAVCGDCEERIETNLTFTKGVKYVELDDETKIVTVGYNPRKTNADKLRQAISEIGYDADDVPADQEAHDKLPACCQKGNKPH